MTYEDRRRKTKEAVARVTASMEPTIKAVLRQDRLDEVAAKPIPHVNPNARRFSDEEVKALLGVVREFGNAIRDLGEVPAGQMYAVVSGQISLRQFEGVIGMLKKAHLVEETPAHLLRWIGPPKP